jgi:hypothetical protein
VPRKRQRTRPAAARASWSERNRAVADHHQLGGRAAALYLGHGFDQAGATLLLHQAPDKQDNFLSPPGHGRFEPLHVHANANARWCAPPDTPSRARACAHTRSRLRRAHPFSAIAGALADTRGPAVFSRWPGRSWSRHIRATQSPAARPSRSASCIAAWPSGAKCA